MVFPACNLPSLIAILHHQDMPDFLFRMSHERDSDARDLVLTMVKKVCLTHACASRPRHTLGAYSLMCLANPCASLTHVPHKPRSSR